MMMKSTETTLKALAWYVGKVRLEAGLREWEAQGILVALRQATDRGDIVELTTAAVRCALNPKVETPAVIAMAGPHWEQAPATVHQLHPARPGGPLRDEDRCPIEGHRQQPAAWCGLCRGQFLGGDGWPDGTRHVEARRFADAAPETEPDYRERAAGDTD